MGSIKWGFLVLIVVVLYLNRRMLSGGLSWVMGRMLALVTFSRSHESTARRITQSIMTPVVLLGLLLPSGLVSGRLSALLIFLLWLSVVYQVIFHVQRRARAKSANQGN